MAWEWVEFVGSTFECFFVSHRGLLVSEGKAEKKKVNLLPNHDQTSKVPLFQHEMRQRRDAAVPLVALVVQLVEVEVEAKVAWHRAQDLFPAGNCALVVGFGEAGDVVIGDVAAFFGKFEGPEGTEDNCQLSVVSWKLEVGGAKKEETPQKGTYKVRPSFPVIHPAL